MASRTLKSAQAGLAAIAALALPFSGAANAEDTPAVTNASTMPLKQELALLRQASDSSREHAMAGYNIGLVLHAGDDITRAQVPIVTEHYRALYQSKLDEAYPDQGGVVRVFVAPNPGTRSSGFHVNIGDDIFQVSLEKYGLPDDLDPALLNLLVAREAADDVVRVLPVAKAVQAVNENDRQQTASLSSYTPVGLNR